MAFSLMSLFSRGGGEKEMPDMADKEMSNYEKMQKSIEQRKPSIWESVVRNGGFNLGAFLQHRDAMNNWQNQMGGFNAGAQGAQIGKPSLMSFMNRPQVQQGSNMAINKRRMY